MRDQGSYADPELRVHDIERLAALIREVDGNHDLGAEALAERLIDRGVRVSVRGNQWASVSAAKTAANASGSNHGAASTTTTATTAASSVNRTAG